ncbi:MAG: GIY-YIG nuclease family protein, partial [bacterium]
TLEEAKYYVKLEEGDPYRIRKAVAYTLTPCDEPGWEGWEEVTYYGEGIIDPTLSVKKPEWVYVLVNKSMPGICKIGMTTTSVNQRVNEINQATGVITPWFSVYKYKCINSRILEKAVHQHLEKLGYRVNPKREGFEISSKDAIAVIELLGEQLTVTPKDFDSHE